jgi:hypothetical protein
MAVSTTMDRIDRSRAEGFEILSWVSAFASGNINNEQQNLAARDVAQEFVPESKTEVRAFNQTGDIGNRRPSIIGKLHHADNRMQRRKRIHCHLWTRCRDFPEQRRFARVRITDQCSIRNRAQLERK